MLGDLYKVVSGGAGAVSDVVIGTTKLLSGDLNGAFGKSQKLLVDTKKFLDGTVGLGADLAEVSKRFAENPFVKSANSAPLVAAQTAIFGMRLTTGFGDPADGEDLAKGAKLFGDAVITQIDAYPRADRWDGTAAEAYKNKNDETRRLTSGMNVADEAMHKIIKAEADQVSDTRKTLDDWSNYLYDFGLSTAWMYLIPGGAAAKQVVDYGAAATALGATGFALQALVRDSFDNAGKVREQIALYQRAADESEPDGGACDPFPPGDGGTRVPPTRVDPPVPNQRPAPEDHTPARPADFPMPAPGAVPATPAASVPPLASTTAGAARAGSPAPSAVAPGLAPSSVPAKAPTPPAVTGAQPSTRSVGGRVPVDAPVTAATDPPRPTAMPA